MLRLSPKYKQARSRWDFELRTATFGSLWKSSEHLWQCSEVVGTSSAMFGSRRKFFWNSDNMDTKITRIRLRKSWQVYVSSPYIIVPFSVPSFVTPTSSCFFYCKIEQAQMDRKCCYPNGQRGAWEPWRKILGLHGGQRDPNGQRGAWEPWRKILENEVFLKVPKFHRRLGHGGFGKLQRSRKGVRIC